MNCLQCTECICCIFLAIKCLELNWKCRHANTLRPWQNGRHLPDDILKCTYWMKICQFRLIFHWSFSSRGPINNIPALAQIMAWRRIGDKTLSEPILTQITEAYMRYLGEMSQTHWYICDNAACYQVTVAGAVIPIPCHVVTSLELIWRSSRVDEIFVRPILKWFIVTWPNDRAQGYWPPGWHALLKKSMWETCKRGQYICYEPRS